MLISPELAKAFNEQIGHEFGASLQYLAIAAHFYQRSLTLLAKLFEEQAEEEKQHAMKFVKYVQDTKGGLHIPAIPAPKANFATAEEAVQAALNWEKEVTRQITALMATRQQRERLPGAELSAVVHRRAARGSRQDGAHARASSSSPARGTC